MKLKGKYIFLSLFIILLVSCNSNRVTRDKAQASFKDNDYETAISYLKAENIDNNLIDLNLDEAMLLFLNGQYKESSTLFNSTGYQMAMYTGEMTVGQMIQAGLISEESITYVGPAYEYALIDIMNAYNYIMMDDLDNARAMMRRSFNNNKSAFNELKAKLREIEIQSEKAFNSSQTQNAIRDMADEGLYYDFNSFVNTTLDNEDTEYGLSPFVFFLGSALFANNREYELSYDWMRNIKPFISKGLASSVIDIPQGMGSIDVVTLSDTIVKREEAVKYIPMLIDMYGLSVTFKLTWPVVSESFNIVKNIRVKVRKQYIDMDDNIKVGPVVDSCFGELIEDFDSGVRLDVASKAEGAFARSLIRNITRKTATYLASILAVQTAWDSAEDGTMAQYLAYLAAVTATQTAMAALDATECADTRQCVFFPSKAHAAGFILEPGLYTVEVEYMNKSGRVIKTDMIHNVEVNEGLPTVVPSEYINTGNLQLDIDDYYY